MKKNFISLLLTICIVASIIAPFSIEASATTGGRDWTWPVPSSNKLSSCFLDGRNHRAIDIVGAQGTNVVASYAGKVIETGKCSHSAACECNGGLGKYVKIEHTYDKITYISRYSHLDSIKISVGKTVKANEVIGTVGTTGRSTGYHLDFQIYKKSSNSYMDPLLDEFLKLPSGLNAGAATTDCCYTYVKDVNKLYDKLSISGHNYPTTIKKGGVFSIKGTVRSESSKITSLTVGVYDSAGNLKTGKTVNPNAKSYNIAKVDASITFNKLAAGTYNYKVIAQNSQGSVTLLNVSFTVTPASDKLSISGHNYPTTIKKGNVFSIKGTVKSESSKITSLTVGVYDSAGNLKTGKTVNPNATSYNIAKVDAYITFNKLAAGTYNYKVIAQNSQGSVTLLNVSFTVK